MDQTTSGSTGTAGSMPGAGVAQPVTPPVTPAPATPGPAPVTTGEASAPVAPSEPAMPGDTPNEVPGGAPAV